MSAKQTHFIVTYDDGDLISSIMGWDDSCKGALCYATVKGPIAIFHSRAAARKAIVISSKFAALCRAQGAPENTDFLEGRKFIRIVPCQPNL